MHVIESYDAAPGYTLVSFHAHPDDEALFTGGTLARAVAEGHRVVLVVATGGERGLTDQPADNLGAERHQELARSAAVLGVQRVVLLGYEDSGMVEPKIPPPGSLCAADVDEIASRLAAVLQEEHAHVLTTYDAAGGYGHRDHIQVHRAGLRAATLAGTPVVLQATVKREAIRRAVRLVALLRIRLGDANADTYATAFTPGRDITHTVNVRRWTRQKRAALRAHGSQTTGGPAMRLLAFLLRLPSPIFRLALGHEWFVEVGRPATGRPVDDIFDSLRSEPA